MREHILKGFFEELEKLADEVHKKTEFQGIPIHIDRPKGFVQDFPGKVVGGTRIDPWKRTYKVDYGFIPGTKAKDGDELDVYLGPRKTAPDAYIIKQMKNGKEDEKKVMLGFKSEAAAKKMYLSHFVSAFHDELIGGIKTVPVDEFRKSLPSTKTAATFVGGGGSYAGGGGFSGNDSNGQMHRFINAAPMMHMKSSGTFQGMSAAPGGGFMPAFSGGEGGYTSEVPGGMIHNYAPSAKMRAAMQKMGGIGGATSEAKRHQQEIVETVLRGAYKDVADTAASVTTPIVDAVKSVLPGEEKKTAEKTLREAFEEKLDDKGRWTGGLNSDGYPKMRDGKEIRLASHVALELAGRGPAPKDKVVAHNDNNPKNISPNNLRITTQKANLQQAEDQGRWRPRGPNKD
jgi:inorganic pyrophosphatase